jgi:CubicO group peptidase (beta-lactamase class C family)
MGMESVDRLMRQAIAEKIFPGGVLIAAKADKILLFEAYGFANLMSSRPMTRETIFDMASLTKPLATTLAVMKLVQHHQIELEQPLGQILTEFRNTDKEQVTLKHLLYHNSGYPDYRPFYKSLNGIAKDLRRDALRKFLVQEPLIHPIGTKEIYSDLGFMILAWVVERVSGRRLDHFVADEVYQPLGLDNLFFIPNNVATSRGSFAATEDCPWRQRVLEGQVHDENAYAVGGVEGHAGLFGTADHVNRLLVELLFSYQGQKSAAIFQKDLLHQFFTRLPGTDRALGFDMPSITGSSSGRCFSQNSVGHLGFTGTSFWMDLERSVVVTLLTNRVHPTRDNEHIKKFRPRLHDTVMGAVGG